VIGPREHIEKAHALLRQARYLLAGGFTDGAARDAYMASFHAAAAFIVAQTGKEPKTHSGIRTEFARLARGDQRVDRAFATFLGRGFVLKVAADYDGSEALLAAEAEQIIAQSAAMVAGVAAVLA
jgi:uncharacterized protein (UPF0332 family)